MSGFFSPNFSVLNEPRYLRSTIRTTMRYLSACLPTATTFAGINVIMPFQLCPSPEHCEQLVCVCLNLWVQLHASCCDESPSFLRTHSKHFSLGRMSFSNILCEHLPHLLSMAKGGRSRALQTDFTPTNLAFGKMNFFSLSSRSRIGNRSIKLSAISDSSVSSNQALFDSATSSTAEATAA